jgi:hypothetical protein
MDHFDLFGVDIQNFNWDRACQYSFDRNQTRDQEILETVLNWKKESPAFKLEMYMP